MNDRASRFLAQGILKKYQSLPQVVLQTLQACNDPETDFSRIADIVKLDAGMSAKILSFARTPRYAQWQNHDDLTQVLVVLGINTVRSLAISSTVVAFFSHPDPEMRGFFRAFWARSLLAAIVARGLARAAGHHNEWEAYLAGLLHKLGQLVFANSLAREYQDLVGAAASDEDLSGEEQRRYGISHVELGARCVAQWHLDDVLPEALRFQQASAVDMRDAPSLVKITNLSSRLVRSDTRDGALVDAGSLLGIDAPSVEGLLQEARRELEALSELLGLPGIPDPVSAPFSPEPDESWASAARPLVLNAVVPECFVRLIGMESFDGEDPIEAFKTYFSLLFGFQNCIWFGLTSGGLLAGVARSPEDRWVNELSVTLSRGRSLLADALLDKRPLDSFDHRPAEGVANFVDRHITRRIGVPGIVAVPLCNERRSFGVLVAGVTGSLAGETEHLRLFAAFASSMLVRHLEAKERIRFAAAEEKVGAEARIRAIAHEINNPLAVISNYLHILKLKLGDDSPVPSEIAVISDELRRIAAIAQGLSAQGAPTPSGRALNLNNLITSLTSVLRSTWLDGQRIDVVLSLEPDLAPVATDKDKLVQILMNLIRNAAEAMPESGRLELTTRGGRFDERGQFIEIGVKDTGAGLPEQVRRGLFSPVASTKGSDHRGLGLSICAQLVRELNGSIQCRTGPQGTEIFVWLPQGGAR